MSRLLNAILGLLLVTIVTLFSVLANAKDTPAEGAPKASPPIMLELKPLRDIYQAKKPMPIYGEIMALRPVTICYNPSYPETSFTLEVFRGGHGKMELAPNVLQLKRAEVASTQKIKLEPGKTFRIRFDLKRLAGVPDSFWKTGEYRVQMKYFLCGKNENDEQAIVSKGPLHLLILE